MLMGNAEESLSAEIVSLGTYAGLEEDRKAVYAVLQADFGLGEVARVPSCLSKKRIGRSQNWACNSALSSHLIMAPCAVVWRPSLAG